jgi:hypothetical protein
VGYSSLNIGQVPRLAAFPGTLVAQSAQVATSGTYYISASALLFIGLTDNSAYCYDTTANSLSWPDSLSTPILSGSR